ncbi:hypothetical protein, partial [Winogradskyella luteola]
MKHPYIKFLPSIIMLFFTIAFHAQQSGIYQSFVTLDINNNGNIDYDLYSPTDLATNTAAADFNGASLGVFAISTETLVLKGGQNRVFKCIATDDITSGYLNYTIYETVNRPLSPTFTGINLNTIVNDFPGAACSGNGNNQDWITNNQNINILNGLASGDYTLEVFTLADYTVNGIVQTNPHYVNNNGNNFRATFRVDNPPEAMCVTNLTVQLDASGNATITAADIDSGSTDDFDTPLLTIDVNTFDCNDIGTAIPVNLTVEDSLGQTDTCTAIITVEDNVDPNAVCQNITVQLDATGNASILPS